MKTILTEYGIPTDRLDKATGFLNRQNETFLSTFCGRFSLTPNHADLSQVAGIITAAVLRGADTEAKVVDYVRRIVMGQPKPPVNAPVTIVGTPIVDTPEVMVAPVQDVTPVTAPVVRYGRGRRKNGRSDFCKAVAVIERLGASTERQLLLDGIVSQGLNLSSAKVYLWRYMTKGERD